MGIVVSELTAHVSAGPPEDAARLAAIAQDLVNYLLAELVAAASAAACVEVIGLGPVGTLQATIHLQLPWRDDPQLGERCLRFVEQGVRIAETLLALPDTAWGQETPLDRQRVGWRLTPDLRRDAWRWEVIWFDGPDGPQRIRLEQAASVLTTSGFLPVWDRAYKRGAHDRLYVLEAAQDGEGT